MRVRTLVAAAFLAATLSTVSAGSTWAAPGETPAQHWTAARRAAAIPRDLFVDERGNGYQRAANGRFVPYGKPGTGGDNLGPNVTSLDPNGTTISSPYTFKADVTDPSGVRSVKFVLTSPSGSTSSFNASRSTGDTYTVTLQGFGNGDWTWHVVAKDGAAGGGNTSTSPTAHFTVGTGGGGGGGGSDVVTNAEWTAGGAVQTAAGRIYFEMPANRRLTRWTGYVCSGTLVTEADEARSVILTAAHCIYDDVYKVFARNVLFIPDQANTSGTGTDRNCGNDPYSCIEPTFGVVDTDWSSRTWPDNIPWDFGFYVGGPPDSRVASLPIAASAPTQGTTTAALGYSYSDDPNFMYCQEPLGTDGGWFLPSCGLSGGASGGPWLQPPTGGDGPIVSVNSYGYTNRPGMGGPNLHAGTSSLSCLFTAALTEIANHAGC